MGIETFLASGIVATLISAISHFYTKKRIEKFKDSLTTERYLLKRLSSAHKNIIKIDSRQKESGVDFKNLKKDMHGNVKKMIKSISDDYAKTEYIYNRIRPLLEDSYNDAINKTYVKAEKLNAEGQEFIVKLQFGEIEIEDKGAEDVRLLIDLLEARQAFIAEVRKQISLSFSDRVLGPKK